MSIRPLLLVAALAGGDYLAWSWSSDGNSETLALITGLALVPLLLAVLWLLLIVTARTLITGRSQRRRRRAARAGQNRAARERDVELPVSASDPPPRSDRIAA